MTNRERAEKILKDWHKESHQYDHPKVRLKELIEQAIDEAVEEQNEYKADFLAMKCNAAYVSGTLKGLEMCKQIAGSELLIEGQTSVKFHDECLLECKEQPTVALRKMHNAAVHNIVDGIRAKAKELGGSK